MECQVLHRRLCIIKLIPISPPTPSNRTENITWCRKLLQLLMGQNQRSPQKLLSESGTLSHPHQEMTTPLIRMGCSNSEMEGSCIRVIDEKSDI